MSDTPTGSTIAYRRDHSWYTQSHGGSASKYHAMGNDCASKCGRARMLDDTSGTPIKDVPMVLRCRVCWPNLTGGE